MPHVATSFAERPLARHGVSPGVNIEPGSDDDGWEVPRPVRLADGTQLQLYKDGEALHAAHEAIAQARRRICLEVYIFHSDETGQAMADLLCRKAREGVVVHLAYDDYGCAGAGRSMFDRMARAGVRLAKFHPLRPWQCHHAWRPFNRDHRKLLVIDDELAGLGGLNIGGEYAGPWVVRSRRHDAPWRDTAVGMRGPGASLLLAAFAAAWRYTQQGGPLERAEFIHGLEGGSGREGLGVLASVPTLDSPLAPTFRRLMREARQSILLTMSYFAPPDVFIDELCAAARRGVRVRLMLPGLSDIPLMVAAARAFYETLLSAGVEIHERMGAVLHAKTLCVDGRVSVVGSTNLDYRSIEQNLELSLLVRSEAFGRQMHALFENDVAYGRPIALGEWRHRPLVDRVVQWAVKRARYLL